ncbi:hypothetical protein HOM13_04130 [Candidatus Woesearchaeota archaeon]|jgi:DNA repair protein NreA|nr:hypothetical protein [Candidatus Woesearchaeota archaeon]MBT5215895.1 hypothetical protein [Candidatus Woesearchaeota archaeon]MBT6402232.1 hypothetical protein [Candidatus Woesearchaeota archaeon]
MEGKFSLPNHKLKYGKKDLSRAYQSVPQPKVKDVVSSEFFSNSPPTVFVGSKLKYPNVNVGILAPPVRVEDVEVYDSHKRWVQEDRGIQEILDFRGNLINSRFLSSVHSPRGQTGGKFLDISQEVGMAKKAVDMEFHLKKKVKLGLKFDRVSKPISSPADLKNMKITDNTKIERPIDKVFSDTDLKAADAVSYLYKKKTEDQKLSQLLSLGTMGLGKNRRLVPTRWSITTVDDIIGKNLIKEIKDCSSINEHSLFFGYFLGNYYLVFLFPDVFSYELFEMYLPGSSWNPSLGNPNGEITVATDYESYSGRKNYASNCVGGYYAARLPLLESLKMNKRQASTLVLRFETPDYWAGLGVWVVREAMKKTMETRKLVFDSRDDMLKRGREIIKEELNFDINQLLVRSKLLEKVKTQMKLSSYFS